MYSKLGIETVFARPYNARAKVIERFFKEFQEGFEKLLPSYIGSSIQNKPAYMMRNEKFHKNLHNEYIPTIDETIKMIDMWLSFKNSQPCPNAPDKTIAEVLSERKRQNIDINTLDDLMLATEVKTIQRNGMHFKVSGYLMIISSKSFSIFFEPTKVFKMFNSTFKLSTFLNYISNSISLNTGATFDWFI